MRGERPEPGPRHTPGAPSRRGPDRIGPYRVLRLLGQGSFGAVYLVEREGGPPLALKLLAPQWAANPEALSRFRREVELAAQLDHPGIVRCLDAGQAGASPYYVMEYVEGASLRDELRRRRRLAPEDAVGLIAALAETLAHAHGRGVLHRDLKPENVLIEAAGGRPRLTDLGLAKDRWADVALTRTGDMIGTPLYMAPERLAGQGGDDPRQDVYGLGVMLYECLTGLRPYDAPSVPELSRMVLSQPFPPLRSLRPELAPDLERLCHAALARDPRDRTPSAEALALALRRWVAEAHSPPPTPAARPGARGRLAGAAVLLLLAAAGIAVGYRQARRAGPRRALEQARVRLEQGAPAGDLAALLAEARRDAGLEAEARQLEAEAARREEEAALLRQVEQLQARRGAAPDRAALTALLEEARALWARGGAVAAPAAAALTGLHLDLFERGLAADATAAELSEQLEAAARLDPNEPRCRVAQGQLEALQLLEELGSGRQRLGWAEGQAVLERVAADGDPLLADRVALARANFAYRRGRLLEAAELCQPLVTRTDRIGLDARYVQSFSVLWDDRYQEGLRGLEALWRAAPQDPIALSAGAAFHSYTGRNPEGERLARAALEQRPDYPDAWISLAFCLNDQGRWEEALQAVSRALELAPDHPRAFLAQAYALGNVGRSQEAFRAYSQVIGLTAPRPMKRALRHRVRLAIVSGDLNQADSDLGILFEQVPDDPEGLLFLGVVRDAQGRKDEADQAWARAARKDAKAFQGLLQGLPEESARAIAARTQAALRR